MPIIKSAKKKMRKDIKKTKINEKYMEEYKKVLKQMKTIVDKTKLKVLVQKAYSIIDKAAKKKTIHKNKANRIKAQVAKLIKLKK